MGTVDRPAIIQGGMGVAVSSWQLAREVAQAGGLGVVSGTALDGVLARVLQDGDPGEHRRRALAAFPDQEMAQRIVERYYLPDGRQGRPYRPNPTLTVQPSRAAVEMSVLGNFVEVWLAKEGHDGPVGINFLEKIQMGTPTAALGAMLAGVDTVIMGAGIPREIPRLLRDLAAGRTGGVTIDVAGATRSHVSTVDPVAVMGDHLPELRKPDFYAIVSLHSLATYLYRDPEIRPDGFVVEGPPAGGHSAPPRGRMTLDERGEPIYGDRDMADLAAMEKIGLPFWLAGAYGTPEGLASAREVGAVGIQAGTIFALAEESGLDPQVRSRLLDELRAEELHVRNDPRASPTGFPFKIAEVPATMSEAETYAARPRLCDLSYLRTPYERADGSLGYRCAAEPVEAYVKKGGDAAATEGRMCLCNGLMANIGLEQHRKDGYVERPAITLGQDLDGARRLLEAFPAGWTARDAVAWLSGPAHAGVDREPVGATTGA